MQIAIDIDDVLADFSEGFIKHIKKVKGVNVEIHDLKVAEWWKAWGKTLEESTKTIYEFLQSEDIMKVEPKTGAIRALKLLKQKGHKLTVITGRPANVHEKTRQWVHDNLPNVFEEVYCTDFHIVNNGKLTKGGICEEIGADLLIDDYPGYAKECLDKGIQVLLFDSFWNHGFELLPGLTRIHNWEEALDYIDKLNK